MIKYPISPQAGISDRELGSQTELLLDQQFIGRVAGAIKGAQKRIWICAYTWRWYANAPEKDIQQFNYQVIKAVKRGVQVRVIMHNRAQADILNRLGIESHRLRTKKTMHTKAILVDDRILIMGSHNLTEKGTAENFESSLLTFELEPILQFENYFLRMWENFSGATA